MNDAGMLTLDNGHKAYQRMDVTDRILPFSEALRHNGIPATRVPFVITNGRDKIVAVLDVTRPDVEVYSPANYLKAIDARRRSPRVGNSNDVIMSVIARQLGVPGFVVVFEPDSARLWVRLTDEEKWQEWNTSDFFAMLKKEIGEFNSKE